MHSAPTLSELIARDQLFAAALCCLTSGLHYVTRFSNFQYYAFPFEGDDAVLTDAMRSEIEAAIGHKLIEQPAIGFRPKNGNPSLLRLIAPDDSHALIRAALDAAIESNLGQLPT
jgi:hypothetical protein